MSQSKRGSLREAWFNTGIGYFVNFAANFALLPLFYGVHPKIDATAILFGLCYTLISVVRSYWIRRVCNRLRAGWFA